MHFFPDHVEYIVKLNKGAYGVVNLAPEGKDKLSLLCFWGDYFKRLFNTPNKDQLIKKLARPCPLLVKAFASQDEVKFAHFKDGKYKGSGLCMMLDADFSHGLIPTIADARIQSKVIELLNYSLKVYWEIHDNCPLKEWVDGLNEI